MVIKELYLGTGLINVSIDDNFGLALESNTNVINNFDADMDGEKKTLHMIM